MLQLQNIKRFGTEQDCGIQVNETGADINECLSIDFVKEGVSVRLHIRSAIDLHRKLGLAISDWMAGRAREFLRELFNA